jgi:HYDIN/CFA65/VesB family protein
VVRRELDLERASPTFKRAFGKVDATTTSKPKKVTLANRGKAPALISAVVTVPPFTFTIASGADTCSGKTIAPKKTCSFEVEYTPTTVGEVDGAFAGVLYNGTSPLVTLKGIAIALKVKKP